MLKVDYVLVGKLSALPDGRFEVRYELVSVAMASGFSAPRCRSIRMP
jgi:hypothetical protein